MHQQLPSLTFPDHIPFLLHSGDTKHQQVRSVFIHSSGLGQHVRGACPSRNTVWLQILTRTNVPQVDSLDLTYELIFVYVSFILTGVFFYQRVFFYRLHPLFLGENTHLQIFCLPIWVGL